MENKLRRLQLTQLEILKMIDEICQKNDISYSLYAGTLLGAVRHKGFIPWDDDLDVCMSRTDYEKFIEIWPSVKPSGYILQNKDNAPKFTQSFSKIRKEHTTFLECESERNAYHSGIFVDIFPLDRIPNGKLQRLLFRWNCIKYQLFTREYLPTECNKGVKVVAQILLMCVPHWKREKVREHLLRNITKYKNDKSLPIIATEIFKTLKTVYPADMLDSFVRLKFEDGEFMCFAKWEENLRLKFGDYMQLPPEEERTWRHHPIILDFEYDYEELKRSNNITKNSVNV